MQTDRAFSRFPSRRELWPVFSVGLFLVCGWALYRVFWYVPSWLEYMSVWSILLTTAYVLSFALLESAIWLGGLALLALALPRRFFRRRFVAVGCMLMLAIGAGSFLVQRQAAVIYRLEFWQLLASPLAVIAGLALLAVAAGWLYERFPALARLAEGFGERMSIFGLLFVPLGLVSWLIVLLRNLFA